MTGGSPFPIFRHFPDFHAFVGAIQASGFANVELESENLHFVLIGDMKHLLADKAVGIPLVCRVIWAFDESAEKEKSWHDGLE